jgi:hypothetical protein
VKVRIALLVAVALSAVSAGAAAGGPSAGGLRGQVRIGPVTPVCRADEPCTKPATSVVLTFTHASRHISARTDRTTGRYRVTLPAGVWSVRASVGMRIAPAAVNIASGRVTVRNFLIDTGIR